jgi:hypothetical protein
MRRSKDDLLEHHILDNWEVALRLVVLQSRSL